MSCTAIATKSGQEILNESVMVNKLEASILRWMYTKQHAREGLLPKNRRESRSGTRRGGQIQWQESGEGLNLWFHPILSGLPLLSSLFLCSSLQLLPLLLGQGLSLLINFLLCSFLSGCLLFSPFVLHTVLVIQHTVLYRSRCSTHELYCAGTGLLSKHACKQHMQASCNLAA